MSPEKVFKILAERKALGCRDPHRLATAIVAACEEERLEIQAKLDALRADVAEALEELLQSGDIGALELRRPELYKRLKGEG